MSEQQAQAGDGGTTEAKAARAAREAAQWYGRLNSGHPSYQDVDAFFAWRAETLNDVAYTRIENLTTTARALADDPRLQAIAQAAARRPRETDGWRGALMRPRGLVLGGLGLVTASALVGAFVILQPLGRTYDTAVGERRAISLEDGSTIELNTDSRVRVRLTKGERRLWLEKGQAMFAVAHNQGRPFIVTAGKTAVRALGTRFEVWRTDQDVRVILAEGKVEVSGPAPQAAPVTLAPGQRLDLRPNRPATPAPVDVAAATGWTQGRVIFRDAPLAEAVAEINRYSRHPVVLGPGVPAQERVTGVFDTGDTQSFVNGVTTMLDLKSAPRPDGGVELTLG
jgi:transmembrane sensor